MISPHPKPPVPNILAQVGTVTQNCNFVTRSSVPSKLDFRYSFLRSSAENITEVTQSVTLLPTWKKNTKKGCVFDVFLRAKPTEAPETNCIQLVPNGDIYTGDIIDCFGKMAHFLTKK